MAAAGGDDGGGDAFAAPSRGTFHAVPAYRKIFRLVRKLMWAAEVQRRLPAALQRRRERAAVEDGAVCEEVDGEAEAEGGRSGWACGPYSTLRRYRRAQGRQRRA